ncbi:cytochrome c peroxidase [Variovorax sp. J22G21]|uniref:cytochrome-c peroxidase n=1 Tax=Variovorax fucosicus TaxID=3053517 RepID=UPI002578FC35|nr:MULTISPECIES: cytochrome c peroxidase [unclassified Variovorax]MDM0039800.1 cytochrome c peroxidase [Variovorax sp. J22R193]MDM0064651.1 cytochrome c peroxidase [Variovorax sp. J22G21]
MHRLLPLGVALLALAACEGKSTAMMENSSTGSAGPRKPPLSLGAQVGQLAFFDQNLSGGRNMSCASCHDPQYAYGPPNSVSVQLGSDITQTGVRAVPSLRYRESTPAYSDDAPNPDGVTSNSPGGGFMWDGRATTLATQAGMPLLNPLEMNNASKDAVVKAVRNGTYAGLFKQAFGADVFNNTDAAFEALGTAIQALETEDLSFHPYSSKYDLHVFNKVGGTLTPAEQRGEVVFHSTGVSNCSGCHYTGANFNGNSGLMTDFTYQALGAPRNDRSIPNNPDPIPANNDPKYFDMGLCGPYRTDHMPATPDTANPYCGMFKVPGLRNVATRGAFFHNGVLHSLDQVVNFYNTRDTNPEYWYPANGNSSSDGTGTPQANPSWALQPTHVPGATVSKYNDLPTSQQGSIDEEVPMGTGEGGDKTLASGTRPRQPGSAPVMTPQQIADLVCFLGTLSDGYQPSSAAPTTGRCVK